MVQRAAFIREDGVINHSFIPSDPTEYPEGELSDGLLVQYFPYEENPTDWLNTKFWNINTQQWDTFPEKPEGEYYDWSGPAANWVLNRERLENTIRRERNILLRGTDWCVLPDSPITALDLAAVRIYRQELRDFPNSLDFTTLTTNKNLAWPEKPSFLQA